LNELSDKDTQSTVQNQKNPLQTICHPLSNRGNSIKFGRVQNCKELIYSELESLLGDGGEEAFCVSADLQKTEDRSSALYPDVFPQPSLEVRIIYEALNLQIK